MPAWNVFGEIPIRKKFVLTRQIARQLIKQLKTRSAKRCRGNFVRISISLEASLGGRGLCRAKSRFVSFSAFHYRKVSREVGAGLVTFKCFNFGLRGSFFLQIHLKNARATIRDFASSFRVSILFTSCSRIPRQEQQCNRTM